MKTSNLTAAAIACLAGLVLLGLSAPAAAQGKTQPWTDADAAASKPLVDLPSFSTLSKKLKPSVVSFYVETQVNVEEIDPMFKLFKEYFKGLPETYTQQGVGSGVIISEDGIILTNSHVLEKVTSIKVVLDTGETFEAKVLGADAATDLAVVKIDVPRKLKPAVLGDSDKLSIGDWVLAIGSPFGLEASVTVGIVSAIGRHEIGPPELRYQDLIQTDAPINPGNSGGPLVDLAGNVVGINEAITATGQGIGFAVPINMAREVIPQLIKKGKVERSWLGVTVQRLTPLLAESFGTNPDEGALVTDVEKDSPAWTTGLKAGDIITAFDGKKIDSPDKLSWYASIAGAGKKVTLKILRNAQWKTLTVKMAPMPAMLAGPDLPPTIVIPASPKAKKAGSDLTQGLKVAEVDAYTGGKLGLAVKAGKAAGAIITAIDDGSPLAKAGLDKGDVVTEINGTSLSGPGDFLKALKGAAKGDVLRFYAANKKSFIALKK